jgi:hypothetical protein
VPGVNLVAKTGGVRIDEPSLIRAQRQPDGPWQEVPGSGVEVLTVADGGPYGECRG